VSCFFTAYFWIAVCIYHEARGESQEGKVAVAQVIQNRALRRRLTVEQVIIQDKQFSWYNGGRRPPITNYDAFINCIRAVASMAMQRLSGKNLFGADHYYSTDIVPPSWAKHPRMKFIEQIGNHRFFRWDG
jgi:N-acetylmuramoyl-L-alanine amidase